jgi:hypothetical protein
MLYKKISLPFLLLTLLLVGVSCNTVSSDNNDPLTELRSNKQEYVAGDSLRITIHNYSPQKLFLDRNCSSVEGGELIMLEQLVDGSWEEPAPPDGCLGIYIPPVVIEPGKSHVFKAVALNPGTYRYSFPIYRTESLQGLLSDSRRVTNAFTVRPE